MDQRILKGYWGRGLTQFAKCNDTQKIYLTCTPRLQCYTCESDNTEDCYKQKEMDIMTCGVDVTQCYYMKYKDSKTNAVKIKHSCGVDNYDATENLHTCEKMKKDANCGGDRVCFCKDCYGRLCNSSPLYKAAQAQTQAITGSIDSLMYLMEDLNKLLRVGMFDFSVVSESGNTTST